MRAKAASATAHRTIHASPAQVFEAWIVAELVESWWGPDGFTTVVLELEPRAGGRFRFQMTSPSGASCQMKGTYLEVEPPRRLVFEVSEHCNLDLPEGVAPQIEPSRVTVDFRGVQDGTEVVVTHAPLEPEYSELAAASWRESMERLET